MKPDLAAFRPLLVGGLSLACALAAAGRAAAEEPILLLGPLAEFRTEAEARRHCPGGVLVWAQRG